MREPRWIRSFLILIALGIGAPAALPAQLPPAEARQHCQSAFQGLLGRPSTADDVCRALGNLVAIRLSQSQELFVRRRAADTALLLTPRKLQSSRSGEAVPAGIPGQADAVPTIQPTSLAAASLAAAGTDSGAKAVVAISLNPISLFGSSGMESASKWSRFTDLTVLVPLTTGGAAPSAGLDYFGLRARVNITGLQDDELLAQVRAAFDTARAVENRLAEDAAAAFRLLPDSTAILACARAIQSASWGQSPEACGGHVVIGLGEAARERLRHELARAREQADARYFGLDLRFDTGDPTFSSDSTRDVTSFQAGLAYGRRFLKPDLGATAIAFQARIGGRYLRPEVEPDTASWAVEGALGFEASRLMDLERTVRFTTGVEFRYSNDPDAVAERLQTDYFALRGSVTVPLPLGTSVSVGFLAPLVGELSPNLSVNFNWGLLLSGLAGPQQ